MSKVSRSKRFSRRRAIALSSGAIVILRDTAAALEYIHSKRFVHRDVKPGNILVRPDDHVKVIDFGLAQKRGKIQRTKSGHVMCTAKYMAPELIEGVETYAETDIYALGCMTYELISGKPPFDGDDVGLLTDMHLYSKPKPLCEVVTGLDLNLSAVRRQDACEGHEKAALIGTDSERVV